MYTDPSKIRRAKCHLMSWTSGRGDLVVAARSVNDAPRPGAATVVLQDARHLDAVLRSDLVGPGTGLFVPAGTEVPANPAFTVVYEGGVGEPGDDLSIDDEFFLQTQDYASAEYIIVMGPTAVRVTSESDFEVFLADADRARHDGRFSELFSNPAVQLGDLSSLGAGLGGLADGDTNRADDGSGGPRTRLWVDADGNVSTTPVGAVLGTADAPLAKLDRVWRERNAASGQPCAVALAGAVPEPLRAAELVARPWLGRYLEALEAVRDLVARGVPQPRVTGFGGRLLPALDGLGDGDGAGERGAPLLLWDDEGAYLRLPTRNRTFRFTPDAGPAAEALLVCGSVERAATYADSGHVERVAKAFAGAGIDLRGEAGS